MICRSCGEVLEENAKFCTACGAKQASPEEMETKLNPTHTYAENCAHEGHVTGSTAITFLDAMKLYFQRFADFKGRSRRSEYWWATLGVMLISTALSMAIPELSIVWSLVSLVPSLALVIRRLHDIGKSGWSYLFILIPFVGYIILLVWLCRDSDGANQWGPNPKD